MFKILRYTTETVAKYWDDGNYRIFTFKMNKDQNLIIMSSNNTNSKLYGWPENFIGKSLYEVMEKEHADRWHTRYADWKRSGLISYIAYFNDQSVAWETTIEVINDTLFGIGRKVEEKQLNVLPFEQYEFFNHYYIQQDEFVIFTLSVNHDSFKIASIDCNFPFDLSCFLGKDIGDITFFCSNILDTKVYKKCLRTNKVVHYVEQLVINDSVLFFDIYLFPYERCNKIMVYAKKIGEESYRKIQKNISHIYGIYPESDYFGVCEINYEEKENPYVIGCNQYFKKLIDESALKLSYIINNNAFQTCVSNLSKASGVLIYEDDQNGSKKFQIDVTHLSEIGNMVFMVMLCPIELEQSQNLNELMSVLSPREQEVLTYVIKGLTNRYIANKLNITEGTVKKTIYNAYKKLGICSRIELINLVHR